MMHDDEGFTLHPALMADCALVGELPLCRVLLMDDSNYPWIILVPRRTGMREIHELAPADVAQFWDESVRLGRALMAHFGGCKLNVAALGNQVPQLHVHHIVRRIDDPAWPRPIWGVVPAVPYSDAERASLCALLRDLLGIPQSP